MAFNPAKVTVKRARAEAVHDPQVATAANLRAKGGVVAPTVKAVSRLLEALYPLEELFLDTDTGLMRFGDVEGPAVLTELIRELETITGLSGWYEKRTMVEACIYRRTRSPHADRLIAVPKDLPPAALTPWTSRMADPEFADEVLRMMVFGYVLRGFKPGTKFDYAAILTGPEGVGKTTFISALLPGRSVAYKHRDAHPVEAAAECERIDLEEASEELFGRDRFNVFKDRVTITERGEDQKWVRGKTQLKVRAVIAGTSNERYLMPAGLEGTRRILPLVMDSADKTLLPTLTEEVWQQLISEALRRFDADEVPVLTPEGRERQRAALAYVTRPDDDGDLMRHVIEGLIAEQGWFQKGQLQEALMEDDPALARNPGFGYAWRRVQSDYTQVAKRVDGRSTRVYVPAGGAA